jgi:hypothetical protein
MKAQLPHQQLHAQRPQLSLGLIQHYHLQRSCYSVVLYRYQYFAYDLRIE